MTYILASGNANNFNNPVTAVLNGVKKGLLFAFGFALVLMFQVTFFSPEAIASPLASIGNPTIADKSKDFAKEAGNRTKDLAKNVKEEPLPFDLSCAFLIISVKEIILPRPQSILSSIETVFANG